jgi:radical SAM protein with 4Fe4S-binding SPASM domain
MATPSLRAVAELAFRHPRYLEHLLLKKLHFAARYRWVDENPGCDNQAPQPLVYKLVLTYRCNLRCSMCYEWGDAGWCKQDAAGAREELGWSAIDRIFNEHAGSRPSFILIGGEPLLYSHWKLLAQRLRDERCFAITCTNGTVIDRHFDVSEDNRYLTYLISLDGQEAVNDRIRGRNTYRKIVENIRGLKALRRPPYVGIQFTVRPENIAGLYDFCVEMVDLGVDWVLINPTWFIDADQARAYEEFMQTHFSIRPKSHLSYLLPFDLDTEEFERQYRRIRAARWPIQISCYLKEPADIHPFVNKPAEPLGNWFCYKQWLRMDVTPDGAVSPCILYPDLAFGDLKRQSVMSIWNSREYAHFREVRRKEVLPICSKCDALYLYDPKRKSL